MSSPVNPELEQRLAAAEQQLKRLMRELVEIRRLAEGAPAASPTAAPPLQPTPPPPTTATPVAPRPAPPPPAPPREPRFWERDLDFGELLGAKGLAWAGGIVTVLGVVFFFVLAVNRGWIGPSERVGLGTLASLLVFGAGFWVHRRYGPTYAAYGAVGAGIAGGYATLVAAAALYELVFARPREALPLRPREPQLGDEGTVVPGGGSGAASRRLLLPAADGAGPRGVALLPHAHASCLFAAERALPGPPTPLSGSLDPVLARCRDKRSSQAPRRKS
jgi:hypothetical protein